MTIAYSDNFFSISMGVTVTALPHTSLYLAAGGGKGEFTKPRTLMTILARPSRLNARPYRQEKNGGILGFLLLRSI